MEAMPGVAAFEPTPQPSADLMFHQSQLAGSRAPAFPCATLGRAGADRHRTALLATSARPLACPELATPAAAQPSLAQAAPEQAPPPPDPEWLLVDIVETAQTCCAVSDAVQPSEMRRRKVAIFYLVDTPVAVHGKEREHTVRKGMYEGRVLEVRRCSSQVAHKLKACSARAQAMLANRLSERPAVATCAVLLVVFERVEDANVMRLGENFQVVAARRCTRSSSMRRRSASLAAHSDTASRV